MSLSSLPLRLTDQDFDESYKLMELPQDYECQLCFMFKEEHLECKKCNQGSCKDCIEDFSKRSKECNIDKGIYHCSVCHNVGPMNPQNKILRDIMNHLNFICNDKCKQTYPFNDLMKHKQRNQCYLGYKRPSDQQPKPKKAIAQSVMEQPGAPIAAQPVVSLAQSLFAGENYKDSRPAMRMCHMLQKDSKNIYAVDFKNPSSRIFKGRLQTQFPHNFQAVNGPNGQLYMVGGGDYQRDDESLYNLFEIQTSNSYNFIKRDSMKHPRHGHSAIWFGEKFIVVTGSRKEKNSSQVKCEMHNTDIDLWFEMPDLNVGRHYHSSCAFNDKFIYVFCGIANATRKYINSIEKYDHDKKKRWEVIEVSSKLFGDRQGCGVIQRDNKDILIFGGFSGRFLKDSYLMNVHTNQLTRTQPCPNECFLFQMPICYDGESGSIYSCDLQQLQVYKFNAENNWTINQSLKNH